MPKPLALLFALLALPVQADDAAVLAVYWSSSGSLPPEYAWDTTVTILEDGTLTLKHCTGYETEGPACKSRRARVAQDALTAIRTAATQSGLAEAPAREAEDLMVGGGVTGGLVYLDGVKLELLSQPAVADAARVSAVLSAITAAIPPRFDRFLDPD